MNGGGGGGEEEILEGFKKQKQNKTARKEE